MELDQFIESSLTQLVAGVTGATEAVQGAGGSINPGAGSTMGMPRGVELSGVMVPVIDIEFDVAVSASDSEGSRGGIAVVAGFFGVGGQHTRDASNEQVSRLRFTVPVALPPGVSDERPGEGYNISPSL